MLLMLNYIGIICFMAMLNELKNYHYTTIITGDKYTGHPPHGRMKNKDDVYYILGDLLQMHRGYSYGIVVNKKTYEIIYYYSSY